MSRYLSNKYPEHIWPFSSNHSPHHHQHHYNPSKPNNPSSNNTPSQTPTSSSPPTTAWSSSAPLSVVSWPLISNTHPQSPGSDSFSPLLPSSEPSSSSWLPLLRMGAKKKQRRATTPRGGRRGWSLSGRCAAIGSMCWRAREGRVVRMMLGLLLMLRLWRRLVWKGFGLRL